MLFRYLVLVVLLVLGAAIFVSGEEAHHSEAGDAEHHDSPADDHPDEHADKHAKRRNPSDPDISASGPHYDEDTGEHHDSYDHDVVAGSHKSAEEFKELEPEEAKKRLAILVDRMDTDKDGCVSKVELNKWIMQSFHNLDLENAKNKMEEVDENNDKKLEWLEYVHKSYGYSPKELEEFKKDNSSDMKSFLIMLDDDKMKFDLADLNKDGTLDIEEFVAFSHPQNHPRMAPYEIAKTLHDFDKNKDDMIDINEFVGEDVQMDNHTKEAEKKHFTEFDKNKDGKLDREELVAWVMPGFEGTANAEAEHLITETDDNKDGKVCKDEIIKHHELWVGSHATDYGKHLDDMGRKDEL